MSDTPTDPVDPTIVEPEAPAVPEGTPPTGDDNPDDGETRSDDE